MTYSPKRRATVVRPNNLDPRNNADCHCERIVIHKSHDYCPRHEPVEYGFHNAEHRAGRRAANSHTESAFRSEANCEPEMCYEAGGQGRLCPRHDPALYAEYRAKYSIDSISFFY